MDYNDGFLPTTDLPYSLDAEQTILGAVLIDASVLPTVLEKIKADCFYNEQHRMLFSIIMRMFTSGVNADIITVLNEAMQTGIFETPAEGRTYLASLMNSVPSVANIESYCKIVSENTLYAAWLLSQKRFLRKFPTEIMMHSSCLIVLNRKFLI